MKSVLIAVFLACALAAPSVRAELFACIGPDGKKSFTTNPADPGCKQHPSYEPGAKNQPAPTTPARLAPAPAPKPAAKITPPKPPKKITIPKVAPREQSGRDLLRRQILVHELNREIKSREIYLAQVGRASGENNRDFFRRLIRVHELNILAIRRELDLLGGNSARN